MMFSWIYDYQNVNVLRVVVNQLWFIVGYQQYDSMLEALLRIHNGRNSFVIMGTFLRDKFTSVKVSSRDFSGQNSTFRAHFHGGNTFPIWLNVFITFVKRDKSKGKWDGKTNNRPSMLVVLIIPFIKRNRHS